jgi:hypothetical protein
MIESARGFLLLVSTASFRYGCFAGAARASAKLSGLTHQLKLV